MEERILVPVDGSESAWGALDYALDHHSEGTLTVLHVVDPMLGDYYEETDERNPVRRSEEIRAKARERIPESVESLEIETETVTGNPADAILAYAETNDIEHIVMGSRGRSGLSRLLLGSVAETVVRRASCPVTVVR